MTKNVTLRGIKEKDYNLFKEKAEKENITISEMFSKIISQENTCLQNENKNENISLQDENISLHSKIKELQSEIEDLQEKTQSENNENKNVNISLQDENIRLQDENKRVNNEKTELENIIETLNNQLQTKENNIVNIKENNENNKDFLLNFTGFDLYMILSICKDESQRTGKNITPAELLKATFVNYVANDSFYFESPSYFKLKRLERDFKEGKISINDFKTK